MGAVPTVAQIPAGVLRRIASGDPGALRECIDRHGSLIWSLARRFTRSAADAEDATQDIFLNIWQHAARFDPSKASEKVFVAMIARRRLIDRIRHRTVDPLMDISTAESLETLASTECDFCCEASLDSERAVEVLASIRPEQRRVLELAFMGGMSHQEISEHLSLPLGTVKSSIRRGLLHIRDSLSRGLDTRPVEAASSREQRVDPRITAIPILRVAAAP